MKKLFAVLLAAAMLLGLGNVALAEKTEVTMWYYWETVKHQETLNAMLETYNASQENVEVKAECVPFADFKKQVSIGATADVLPDIVIIDNPDHANYSAMGIFADITDKIDVSAYYDGPVASCMLDGRLYGVPCGSNCLALYYNEDMLKAAGCEVPTTWEELKTVAAACTKDNVYGIAFCSLQNEEGTFNFMPWVWSTGSTSFEIDNENTIRAINMVKGLVDSGVMPKEAINWTQGDVMNQFISGNLAMMINGPWQVPTMREQAADLNWNVALIPMDTQYASALGGENFAVIDNENVDASVDFLTWMTAPEQVATLNIGLGNIAPRSDVAETQFVGDAIMEKFVEQMQYAQARGPHARWPEISDAISLAFNQAIIGTETPEAAAAAAQATIDSIIE